jgi:hypothetical protein
MINYCYCLECKYNIPIERFLIALDDTLIFNLICGHKRVFQLILSKDDYMNKKEE